MKIGPKPTGLHESLLGIFNVVEKDDERGGYVQVRSEPTVSVPVQQSTLEITPQWTSPFEGAGNNSSFPGLAQMAQAGMFSGILKAIGETVPESSGIVKKLDDAAKQWEGRSGITKLNSTQVFSGLPPAKIQITLVFKAFNDPKNEVEAPIRTLVAWSLPQYLAPDGRFAEVIKDGSASALMPSVVPRTISFSYKGRIYLPMVIESVSQSLHDPSDEYGDRVSATVQITLCALTAWDRADWQKIHK